MEISISNLSLSFEEQKVFEDLSFTFSEGSFYLLKGDSGCGKSTLLKVLVSLIKQDSGQITYGEDLEMNQLRRKVQLLPQLPVIFPGTVHENLLIPYDVPGYTDQAPDKETLNTWLNKLFPEGLDLEKEALNLSQGQKQRLALGRVLLLKPSVLLCDEPTSALDNKSRQIVDGCLNEFFQDNPKRLIIYISHHDENSSSTAQTHKVFMSQNGLELVN